MYHLPTYMYLHVHTCKYGIFHYIGCLSCKYVKPLLAWPDIPELVCWFFFHHSQLAGKLVTDRRKFQMGVVEVRKLSILASCLHTVCCFFFNVHVWHLFVCVRVHRSIWAAFLVYMHEFVAVSIENVTTEHCQLSSNLLLMPIPSACGGGTNTSVATLNLNYFHV